MYGGGALKHGQDIYLDNGVEIGIATTSFTIRLSTTLVSSITSSIARYVERENKNLLTNEKRVNCTRHCGVHVVNEHAAARCTYIYEMESLRTMTICHSRTCSLLLVCKTEKYNRVSRTVMVHRGIVWRR